ncbi:hypothetical protein BH23PLA1_BH23PLA1_05470 [soil metagenome]
MRLTLFGDRRARLATATALACMALAGCQRLPYIDQSKTVPHDHLAAIEAEDLEVRQAAFFSELPTQLPRIDPPRTPDNPDTMEIWNMSLQEAIQIGMDNSEVIRVISLGAQGIPITGFEPTPLNTQAGSALGAGTLATVYDPAIQETQIARALSAFDAQLTTRFFYQRSEFLVNNALQAGFFGFADPVPALIRQAGAPQGLPSFEAALQRRFATGAVARVANQVDYQFSNSPVNTFPSAYNARTLLQFSQPLLGGSDQTGPSGLEANRAPIVIQRLNADVSVWRFKAEIMAMVRSIEQQYWALAQQQVQYWSRRQAVKLGEAILERELTKLIIGTGAQPDVAEAEERLRSFQLELVQATGDLINTERQLRNILGLKPNDNRRIVPITAPTDARLEPNWDTALAQMVSFQPDIIQQQLLVRVAELQLLLARNQLLPSLNLDVLYQFNGFGQELDDAFGVMTGQSVRAIDPIIAQQQQAAGLAPTPGFFNNFTTWQIGFTFSMPLGFRGPLADSRQAQYALLRQRAFLQQVVHQTTHALARFFIEIDQNYKLLKYAGLAREAAERRLEAQRAFFEAGTINIDRYLDAVNNWSNAVAREAQFKTAYNISIAALEEAKGTLLAYDNIAVAEGPQPRKANIQAIDQRAAHRSLGGPGNAGYAPEPVVAPPVPDPVPPMPTPDTVPPSPSPVHPAPYGLLGPRATPVAPTIPAGPHEYNIDAGRSFPVGPASPMAPAPIFDLDALPGGPIPIESSGPNPIPFGNNPIPTGNDILDSQSFPPLPPLSSRPVFGVGDSAVQHTTTTVSDLDTPTLSTPIALPPLPPESRSTSPPPVSSARPDLPPLPKP